MKCREPAVSGPALQNRLQAGDVRSLEALRAPRDFELNCLAFIQRFVPVRLNGGEVDENILPRLALDEPEAFARVKPLHCSLFLQLCFSFLIELFGATLHRLQAQKKARKCGLADLAKSDGLQEQQTHLHSLMIRL
jgi:hypothetical protein